MSNPSQVHPASSKDLNQVLKDMDVLCTFIIKIESKKLDIRCIKNQWQHPNQDQDATPQSGNSRLLQSPIRELKGHGFSFHLQNQDREPKLVSWVYQIPVTISKSRPRFQTPVRNLQHPPKLQMRIWNMGVSKTSGHIRIKIKMQNPSQDHQASPKSKNE